MTIIIKDRKYNMPIRAITHVDSIKANYESENRVFIYVMGVVETIFNLDEVIIEVI